MQDKPSGAGHERATPTAEQDDRDQAAVLREILSIYPEPVTLAELIREQTIASADFAERDRIERAVRDLTATGLIHRRDDDLVMPTRPAVRLYALLES
ncbi:MAG TPA: hypothetical protein VFI17_09130 [Solirubrobacterales bacterium]|nr:hypothetical protein [Solirubrobacterales bacterium]